MLWDGQMTASEKLSLRQLANHQPPVADATENLAEQSVTWAEEHLFERRSVVQEHELWRHALEHARGRGRSTPQTFWPLPGDVIICEIKNVPAR